VKQALEKAFPMIREEMKKEMDNAKEKQDS
jgi:hypothetical protein